MKYPFIIRSKESFRIRLCKDLYDAELIERVRKDNADAVVSVAKNKDYYLVELRADNYGECFDFLNCLINGSRNT